MDGLEMLDPANSMTTLTPMSETPSITSPHHQLHGSYHGMNHIAGFQSHHHHGGSLGGHTPGMNHYGKHFSCTYIFYRIMKKTKSHFDKVNFEINYTLTHTHELDEYEKWIFVFVF